METDRTRSQSEQPGLLQHMSSKIELSEARRRLPLNLFANGIWLILNVLVNLWYTPYLIAHLGITAYGLVPLASSVTSYLSVLTTGLNDAISRYLTIDLTGNTPEKSSQTFSTAVIGSFILVMSLLPIAIIITWFTPQLFNIPSGHEYDAQLLLLLTAGGFLVTTFFSSFAVSSFALHRFDLRLLVNILKLVFQFGSIILLFNILPPALWQVGCGILISSLIFGAGHSILWRKLTPDIKFSFTAFAPERLKELYSFSLWVVINMVGAMLFLNIDLIVANRIFGPEIAGRYGSVIIFPTYLRAMVLTANGVFMPITLALFAAQKFTSLIQFSRLSVKFLGIAIALPVGLLCGLSKPLLAIWLGPQFVDLSLLVIILVGHLSINVTVTPLFSLQVATNKVRLPGLTTLGMGIVNIFLAIAFSLWSGWGYISIAIAGAIVLTIKNTIFTPLYTAYILKLPWWTFLPSLVSGLIGSLAVGLGSYGLSTIWTLNSWVDLIIVGAVISAIYVIIAYFGGLNTADRELLKSEIEHRLK